MEGSSSVSCETRAFFVIDALSDGCLVWARQALQHLGGTLAMAVKRPPPIGIAILQRKGAKQSTQLQVLLRPGSSFQLREYHTCIGRVTAAAPDNAADGKTLGGALKALIEHMMTLPGGSNCHNHVFIISSRFSAHPLLHKVIQVCCNQLHASLHFLQLDGPEVGLNSQPELDVMLSGLEDQQQQQQFSHGLPIDSALQQCIRGCAPFASFDCLTADCDAVVDLLCQTWLRELMANSSHNVAGGSNAANAACPPDLLLQLDEQQVLPCRLQQHLLQLDPWLLPVHLCPCHSLPMHPPHGSSSMSALSTAATGCDSDAATAAALLALPEEIPWRCGVTGQPIMQGLNCCSIDTSVIQLGRHTQLKTAPVSTPRSNLHDSRWQGALPVSSLALPAGQPCVLTVKHVVELHEIDSMMIYGMPLVVIPAISSSSAPLAGQQQQQMSARMTDSCSESRMLMQVVCQLLLEQQQVLLACSRHDVHRRCQTPLQHWYMLQPAADGCSLLLRCLASREQLLPPKGYQGVTQMEGQSDGEQVVLLDADQLEAVRNSLASLGLGSSSSNSGTAAATEAALPLGSSGLCKDTKAAQCMVRDDTANETTCYTNTRDQPVEQVLTAEATEANCAAGASAVADGIAASANGGGRDGDSMLARPLPLLLSCGLHDWVASVLESSTCTYAAPPVPAAPLPAAASASRTGATCAHGASNAQQQQPPDAPYVNVPAVAGPHTEQQQLHNAGLDSWQHKQQQQPQPGNAPVQQQLPAAGQAPDIRRRRIAGQPAQGRGTVSAKNGAAAEAAEAAGASINASGGGKQGRNVLNLRSSRR